MPGISIDASKVQTNIVIYDVSGTGMTGKEGSDKLKERGVLSNAISEYQLRMLTHFDVNREQCERAMAVMSEVLVESRVPVGAGRGSLSSPRRLNHPATSQPDLSTQGMSLRLTSAATFRRRSSVATNIFAPPTRAEAT